MLTAENKVKINLATLRMGRKASPVDNASQGDVFAAIDLERGVLKSRGYSHDKKRGYSRTELPATGVWFAGFKIPHWPDAASLAIEAANRSSFSKTVVWDIAITPSGPILIEGNDDHSFVSQLLFESRLQPETRQELTRSGIDPPEGVFPPINLQRIREALKMWIAKKD